MLMSNPSYSFTEIKRNQGTVHTSILLNLTQFIYTVILLQTKVEMSSSYQLIAEEKI